MGISGSMEKKLKKLFERVIKKLKGKFREEYVKASFPYCRCKSRDGNKFTVLGLCDLASNHLFDDLPYLFGISELEGHKIREYFQSPREIEENIKEMYKEFPGVFEGESRRYIDWKNYKLSNDIPLFD